MAERVQVFIDYQNVYKRAREAFALHADMHSSGQIHPYALGHELAIARGPDGHLRELSGVRVYRGLPDARKDPRGNAACTRQLAFWDRLPKVTSIKRPLQYPPAGSTRPVREKGIDVQIAVDLVMGAVEDSYDIAVLFSADTDLIPAVEAVLQVKGRGAVEVATWQPNQGWSSRLKVATQRVWCHYLDQAVFESVCDDHDYNSGHRP